MKKRIAFVSLALSIIMILAPATWAMGLRASDSVAESTDELDFSYENSSVAYVSPADLLAAISVDTEALAEAERDYLNGYFEHYLTYSSTLPAELVALKKEGNTLTVTASVATYTTANGARVTYVPAYALVGEARHELTYAEGKYTLILTDTDAEAVKVAYNGALPIPAATANRLLNFTYNEATNALASAEYLAKYNEALREYEAYLAAYEKYKSDLELYTSYTEAINLYNEAMIEYEKNLAEVKAYPALLEAYNAYVAANNKYLSDMEAYRVSYAEYEKKQTEYIAYIENLNRVRSSLVAMESLFTEPENGTRCLFEALQNEELVRMFEKYQTVLIKSFGVKEADIKYMREYSDELNELLRQYSEKRKISEEEAFLFYGEKYSRISFLFNGLYEKMTVILTPTVYNLVCGKLELEYGKEMGEYKKWRVKNVLSHIYLICLCLDDNRSSESTWQFYSNDGDPHIYYFSDLLPQKLIITDTNSSDPSSLSWIAPVEQGEAPALPTRPEAVEKPVEPIEMPEPQKPREVVEPTEPRTVSEPTLPESFDNDLILRTKGIIGLVQENELSPRKEFSIDPIFNVQLFVTGSVNKAAVTVYGKDGEIDTELSSLSLLNASAADFSDDRHTFSFKSWSLSPVEYIPLPESSDTPISVYPLFTRSKKSYTVTFSFDGRETEKSFFYGELPTYADIDVKKASDALYDYTLCGFDKALVRVSADAYYVAEYIASDRIFNITFDLGNRTVKEKYVRGSRIEGYPTPPTSYISGASLFVFDKWDKPLEEVTSDTVYKACFIETVLAEAEGEKVTVSETVTGYRASGSGALFSLSELIDIAADERKDLVIAFEDYGAELSLGVGALMSLQSANAEKVALLYDPEKGIGYSFSDPNGTAVTDVGNLRLRLFHELNSKASLTVKAIYANGFHSDSMPTVVKDGYVEIAPPSGSFYAGAYYKPVERFSFNVTSAEGGNAYSDTSLCREGDSVRIYVNPNGGHVCSSFVLVNKDSGEETVLTPSETVFAPAFNAELRVEFIPVEYTVTFIYGDSSEDIGCRFGETPTPPQIPLSFTKDGYFYTFIGWSSPISMATGDATYTAKYYSVLESERSTDDSSAIMGIIERFVFPVLIVITSVAAVVIFLAILKKKGYIFKSSKSKTNKDKKKHG